jgi:antitoxin MazE
MRARIVRIGNSQGVRLPKTLLERSGLGDEVEIEAEEQRIVIRPARRARDGWDAAFQAMAAAGEDELLDELDRPTQFDQDEWSW